MDSAGDGGAVDAVEDAQSRVRDLEPQYHKGGNHPIGEYQLIARPASLGLQSVVNSAFTEPGVLPCHPRDCQLIDERAELSPRDASADAMRKRRAGQDGRHNLFNLYGSPSCHGPARRFAEILVDLRPASSELRQEEVGLQHLTTGIHRRRGVGATIRHATAGAGRRVGRARSGGGTLRPDEPPLARVRRGTAVEANATLLAECPGRSPRRRARTPDGERLGSTGPGSDRAVAGTLGSA